MEHRQLGRGQQTLRRRQELQIKQTGFRRQKEGLPRQPLFCSAGFAVFDRESIAAKSPPTVVPSSLVFTPPKIDRRSTPAMCGIVALFSHREPISEEALCRATQSLHHRGPDGQRHWISSDRKVALGHARLSIIDLTTGDQPIASEDERTPHRRQRRVLRLRSHPARARTSRTPSPHPLRQRNRPPPLRRSRHAMPSPAARRVRLRPLGSNPPHRLRRPRPLRHQTALLRNPQ